MPMLIDVLLIVIACRHIALCSAEINVTQSTFFDTENDDRIFDEYVLLDVMARSKFGCAGACVAKHGCDAFTFVRGSPVTSSGSCRLHSGFVGSEPATPRTMIGARTFAKKRIASAWLHQTCSGNATCAGPLTSCHVGQCLCQPAAYYSNGADVCVLSCEQSDLSSTFLVYCDMDTQHVTSQYVAKYDQDVVGQCLTDCVDHAGGQCHAIVHGVGSSYFDSCYLVPSFGTGYTEKWSGWNLYKRTCV